MKIPSSQINQRIEIYKDEDLPNSSGGVISNSELYWATNAQITLLSAPRDIGQDAEVIKPTIRFRLNDRIDKQVLPNMLIKYLDAWFTILDARPDLVYVGTLEILAITSDYPTRILPLPLIGFWWTSADGRKMSDVEIITKTPFLFTLGQPLIIPFRVNELFYGFAYPRTMKIATAYEDVALQSNRGSIGTTQDLFGPVYTSIVFRQHNTNYASNQLTDLKIT